MMVPWIEENIQVVIKLSRIDVWNQHIWEKDNMCIGREDVKNNLRYVDYSILCYVVLSFPKLSPEFLKNGITFPLSNSERATERGKNVLMV